MAILRDARKRWVPLIKLAVASGADIWGDYVFYDRTDLDEDSNLDKYELPLYVFWIVSCVFGGLTMFTLLCKGCCPTKSGQNKEKGMMSTLMSCFTLSCLVTRINQVLSMEIIFEDIPQFVITSLISNERGLLTPAAVFNLTTSAFNFLFNILDMVGVDNDDADDDDNDNDDNTNKGGAGGGGGSGGGLIYNNSASRSSRNNNVVVEVEA